MRGYEAFQKRRQEMGYSQRIFAEKVGLPVQEVQVCERGRQVLTGLPTDKAIKMFSALEISISDFYDEYYPYKAETNEKVNMWKKNNPREYRYDILKSRLYNRIHKLKKRLDLDETRFLELSKLYRSIFESLIPFIGEDGKISNQAYIKYIIPYLHELKWLQEGDVEDSVSCKIIDALFYTEYSYSDLSDFCGISVRHLRRCKSQEADFRKLSIEASLKICYVLNKELEDVFDCLINKQ
ncbi:XRE family transcriptional regulator [bacterium D16-51]|nr:XRE family transcriptional regulator [bacterium D16-59]RKI58757.1 XRE family transcriptional regulator [bacterium D16-51]